MKTTLFSIICLGLVALVSGACGGDSSPGCPFCDNDLQADNIAVPESAEALAVEMAWIAVQGSPTVEDPSLVCEDNFKDVLWRRHVRANSCIWTEQCRIVLTPVFQTNPQYQIIPDPSLATGEEGDIIDNSQERTEIATQAFQQIDDQFKGIVAIQIRRFILENGDASNILGRATSNMGRPYLIVNDPEFIFEDDPDHMDHISTEAVLAHEIGHALNLCHADDPCLSLTPPWTHNLMISNININNRVLVESQCSRARDFVAANLMNSASNIMLTDVIYNDEQSDLIPNGMKHIAFNGLGIQSNKMRTNGFTILLPTQGILKEDAHFLIGFNIDNARITGGDMKLVESNATLEGVDFIVDVKIKNGKISARSIWSFAGGRFTENTSLTSFITTELNTIDEHVYSKEGCKTLPFFHELEVDINLDLLDLPGFERQKATANGSEIAIEARSIIQDEKGRSYQDYFPKTSRPVKIK